MKSLVLLAIVMGSMSVAVAQVSPEEHAAHHPDKAATPSDSPRKLMPSESSMQDRMKSMQDLMNKIDQAKDPAERARLLEQHRKAMHEQLASMKNMDCGSGHESHGMPDKNVPEGQAGGMMGGDMMKCHRMMQDRMAMMIGMMDQMMRRDEAEHSRHSGE